MVLWYLYGSVFVWFCGVCMVLWYLYGSVVFEWFCGICMVLWYLYGSVARRYMPLGASPSVKIQTMGKMVDYKKGDVS